METLNNVGTNGGADQWVQEALISLMKHHSYQDITIKELVHAAGISRRTFYRLYNSKDAVLHAKFNTIWREYAERVFSQEDVSLPNVAIVLFTIMKENADFLRLIERDHVFYLFMDVMNNELPKNFYELKGTKMPFDQDVLDYAINFSLGGFMQITKRWISEERLREPEELGAIIRNMIKIANYQII
jgi:AcrR family transcriptional regulator